MNSVHTADWSELTSCRRPIGFLKAGLKLLKKPTNQQASEEIHIKHSGASSRQAVSIKSYRLLVLEEERATGMEIQSRS